MTELNGLYYTSNEPFQYVGKYGVMSEPNGLYYMRARMYDPSVGRFISEDPKSFDGGDVNLMAYVQNNPIMGIDPLGLASLMVNVNPRGAGSGSIDNSNSGVGHGWATIVNDNGTSTTIGNYPGGPSVTRDAQRVPTSSRAWEVSQAQADAAYGAMSRPGYNFFTHNCVDQVAGALDAAGINHPSFTTLGVSDPSRLNTWVNGKRY